MRLLFCWPVSEMSVWDVARGYRASLAKVLGEDNIKDYWLNIRTSYHHKAMGSAASDHIKLAQYASENLLNEALYFGADAVFMVSVLNVHPVVLWSLRKVGIHLAVLMTESPYDDINQADMVSAYPEATVFTHESTSAKQYGWQYLPHAYDPAIHYPREPEFNHECDVLLVGTGWMDRQRLLEQVDWTGIDLRLYGIWPLMTKASPLYDMMWPVCVDNKELPAMYSSAKICLNLHRSHADAKSLNPRAYEIAACGGFQISDYRDEVNEVFRGNLPTFANAAELGTLVRGFLEHPEYRTELAANMCKRVKAHTFDIRCKSVMQVLHNDLQKRKAA